MRHNVTKSLKGLVKLPSSVGGGFYAKAKAAKISKKCFKKTTAPCLGDEKEHAHGMEVRIWGLAFGQLDGSDAETPDVGLGVVGALLNDLGRHPERRAHKGGPLGHRVRQLPGDTKVGQLYVTLFRQEHVRRCISTSPWGIYKWWVT